VSSGVLSNARDEDGIRRPVSGGLKTARFVIDVEDASHCNASLIKLTDDVTHDDTVRSMMLQKDCEDDDDSGISFHNVRTAPLHPECMSWIDVALAASGRL
jgi:hypothetical protein